MISPLNALIKDQINRLAYGKVIASALNVKNTQQEAEVNDDGLAEENELCELTETCNKIKLESGQYNLLFSHPEALVSCPFGRGLVRSSIYQENVCAIVVDEVHCILEW